MKHGFIKVAAGIPSLKVADCAYNSTQIIDLMQQAEAQKADVLALPAMCISGGTCGDLFYQASLLEAAQTALERILEASRNSLMSTVLSLPVMQQGRLYQMAVVLQNGKIVCAQANTSLSEEDSRWFSDTYPYQQLQLLGQTVLCSEQLLLNMDSARIALMFAQRDSLDAQEEYWALQGANILIKMSCQGDVQASWQQDKRNCRAKAQACECGCIYVAAGMGESSGDHIYGGHALILEKDEVLAEAQAFQTNNQLIVSDINLAYLHTQRLRRQAFRKSTSDEIFGLELPYRQEEVSLSRRMNKLPLVPANRETLTEIFQLQVAALCKRMMHLAYPTLVLGISGGLDSTLSLLVAVAACDKLHLDRKKVLGVTMPGFGTSDRTYQNALELMKLLGIDTQEISIKAACEQHFKDIKHDASQHNVVYENAQARERTQILMDLANQGNGIVIGTGDLSELALGWATYNGDHMSMYATNATLSKTLIRKLVEALAQDVFKGQVGKVLMDIVDTPVSPELLPADQAGNIAQKTEDIVGPYELHDFFLYHLLMDACSAQDLLFMAGQTFHDTYDISTLTHWLKIFLRRFFTQQFKRACMPEGAQVGLISLSPRGAWQMPSDAVYQAWMRDLENL